jgi:hypothetical protein
MSDDLDKELNEEPTPNTHPNKPRVIIDINEEWPWYRILAGQIINGIPVTLWVVFVYFALSYFSQSPELVANRDLTMNISMNTTLWGLSAEIAFLTFFSWFFYLFSFKRVQASAPIVQASCYILWGLLAIAGAIIIAAGIR